MKEPQHLPYGHLLHFLSPRNKQMVANYLTLLQAAQRQKPEGRTGGRPRTDPDKLEEARILYLNSNRTAAQVCKTVGIGRRTLFSYLAQVKNRQVTNALG